MRFPKFIIPVGVSLAAFIWGYRGELLLGDKLGLSKEVSQQPVVEPVKTATGVAAQVPRNGVTPAESTTSNNAISIPRNSVPNNGGQPATAKELPMSNSGEEYAPEDEGETAEDAANTDGNDDDQAGADEESSDESADEGVDADSDEAESDSPTDDDASPEEATEVAQPHVKPRK